MPARSLPENFHRRSKQDVGITFVDKLNINISTSCACSCVTEIEKQYFLWLKCILLINLSFFLREIDETKQARTQVIACSCGGYCALWRMSDFPVFLAWIQMQQPECFSFFVFVSECVLNTQDKQKSRTNTAHSKLISTTSGSSYQRLFNFNLIDCCLKRFDWKCRLTATKR